MKFKSIAILLLTITVPVMAESVSVNTKGMSLVLDVEKGKPAQYHVCERGERQGSVLLVEDSQFPQCASSKGKDGWFGCQ